MRTKLQVRLTRAGCPFDLFPPYVKTLAPPPVAQIDFAARTVYIPEGEWTTESVLELARLIQEGPR